jgi:arylsulfatase A-like enzyme
MLDRADQGIGRILDALDRLKLAQNTLVMFSSDNGGEWLSRNVPLFHRKGTFWEGGIRVPLLVRWPARLAAGTISSQVGITMDLTASILAAAGVKPPDNYRPEGIDLLGPLQKGTAVDRTLFWRMPPAPGAAGTPPITQRAVRRGNWKYIDDRGQYFLFDVRTDTGERHGCRAPARRSGTGAPLGRCQVGSRRRCREQGAHHTSEVAAPADPWLGRRFFWPSDRRDGDGRTATAGSTGVSGALNTET